MSVLRELRRPVVAAPMAGGPSTPELVLAVGSAGGLGFLAGGLRDVATLREDVARVRAGADRPFGVNLFLPGDPHVDLAAVEAYAARLAPLAAEWGVTPGTPVGGDDGYREKLDTLLADPVPVVSFVFGLPAATDVAALRSAGTEVWATVNHPVMAVEAVARGVDALVVQGTEAGGHRGGERDDDDYALLPLLRLVAARCDLPLVAAGGVADGAALAAVLAAGATAAQLGTAFLRCPEAGTTAAHRAAVVGSGDTRLTRAFTGRRARGVVNDFVHAFDAVAPAGYPHVMQVTRPLMAAARAAGDGGVVSHWAGQGHSLGRELPAGRLVEALTAEAVAALDAAAGRTARWR